MWIAFLRLAILAPSLLRFMIKLKYITLIAPVFLALPSLAQQNPSCHTNRIYQDANNLLAMRKYAAAA
jgi:hypothetical protein